MRATALLLVVMSSLAQAQESDLLKGSAVGPPSAPLRGGQAALSPETCAALVRLLPNGGAYEPGVDATGRAVAPADLPGTARPRIDEFPVEITAPVPGASPAAPAQTLLRLGYVTLKDNRAYFNGEPLTEPELDAVLAACRTRR